MARIMITCPVTMKPVFTGMDLPQEMLAGGGLRNNSVGCPHCGQNHGWDGKDGYPAGSPPKPPPR